MYIQIRRDIHSSWVVCQVLDMDEPIETKSATQYPMLVTPLSSTLEWEEHHFQSSHTDQVETLQDLQSKEEEDIDDNHTKGGSHGTKWNVEEEELQSPIFISSSNFDFVSPEQEATLLSSSFSSDSIEMPKGPPLPIIIVDSRITRLSPEVRKYYRYRYHLFSRWDQGIQFDETGLFSVTPESLALHTAVRCACDVAIDAFAGIGGNAIQLARTCNHVIAIDLDQQRLRYLQHNSRIYGVQDKIDCICGNSLTLLPTYVKLFYCSFSLLYFSLYTNLLGNINLHELCIE